MPRHREPERELQKFRVITANHFPQTLTTELTRSIPSARLGGQMRLQMFECSAR